MYQLTERCVHVSDYFLQGVHLLLDDSNNNREFSNVQL